MAASDRTRQSIPCVIALIQQAFTRRQHSLRQFGAVVGIERFHHLVRGVEAGLARQGGGDPAGELVAEGGEVAALGEGERVPGAGEPVGGQGSALGVGQPLAVLVEGAQAMGGQREDERDAQAALARRGVVADAHLSAPRRPAPCAPWAARLRRRSGSRSGRLRSTGSSCGTASSAGRATARGRRRGPWHA